MFKKQCKDCIEPEDRKYMKCPITDYIIPTGSCPYNSGKRKENTHAETKKIKSQSQSQKLEKRRKSNENESQTDAWWLQIIRGSQKKKIMSWGDYKEKFPFQTKKNYEKFKKLGVNK